MVSVRALNPCADSLQVGLRGAKPNNGDAHLLSSGASQYITDDQRRRVGPIFSRQIWLTGQAIYWCRKLVEKKFDQYPDMQGLYFWVAFKNEPFIFGIPEGKGIDYFKQRGLQVVSDVGPKELETRYLTDSDGRLVGPCASGFRIIYATVPAR